MVVDTTSPVLSATLYGNGTLAFSVASISLTGISARYFAQTHDYPATLAAGANRTVRVTFSPTVTGGKSARLSIATSATATPVSVSVSGTGVTEPQWLAFAGTCRVRLVASLPEVRPMSSTVSGKDFFELYDLKVEVVAPPGAKIWCGAKRGDFFTLQGEMLSLPPGQGFSIYSLAAVMPLLAAKQRVTDANDWMSTDAEVACPDPNCPSRLRITRTGKRRFRHADTTAEPLPAAAPLPGGTP